MSEAPTEEPEQPARFGIVDPRWVVLAGGFLILFAGGGRLAIFGLVLKPMSEDLDISRGTLSLVVTISTVVAAPSLLVTGRLLDRYSLRMVMLVATLISGLSLVLLGFVQTPWQLFLLYGVAFPLANPGTALLPVQVMISRWFQRGHGMANAVAQSGSSLGQLVLIGLIATFLDDLGWRAAFTAAGLVFLLTVIPLVVTMVPAARTPRITGGSAAAVDAAAVEAPVTLRSFASNRSLWALTAVYVICGFHDTFVTTHLVAFATDQGVSQSAAGQLLAVMGVLAMTGVLAAGAIAHRIGASAATMLCFLLRVVIFGMVIATQSEIAVYLFGLMFAFTLPITAPLVSVFARDLFGYRHLGTISSFILMVHQVGGGLGALAGGVIFDIAGSYEVAFMLMGVLAAVAAGATLILMRQSQPEPVAA